MMIQKLDEYLESLTFDAFRVYRHNPASGNEENGIVFCGSQAQTANRQHSYESQARWKSNAAIDPILDHKNILHPSAELLGCVTREEPLWSQLLLAHDSLRNAVVMQRCLPQYSIGIVYYSKGSIEGRLSLSFGCFKVKWDKTNGYASKSFFQQLSTIIKELEG